jgi:hypothetical protein
MIMACGYCPSTSWSGQPGQRKRDVRPHPAAPSQRAQQGQGLDALAPGHEQVIVGSTKTMDHYFGELPDPALFLVKMS